MKLIVVLVAAAAFAAPAAAAARSPSVVALQKQVARLQRQVAALQTQVTQERNERLCRLALADDTNRTVFAALDQFAKFLTGATVPAWDTYLGLPRYDDKGACAASGITRP